MILRQLEVYHVRLKQDNRKKIVEVVSDPSGEAFESLSSLHLPALFLRSQQRFLRLLSIGYVINDKYPLTIRQ